MENLNNYIDSLQNDKLADGKNEDQFFQELLNGFIDNIQDELENEKNVKTKKEKLNNIIKFIDSLNPGEILLKDIKEFFDNNIGNNRRDSFRKSVGIGYYNTSKIDSNTGYPIIRSSVYSRSDASISYIEEEEYEIDLSKAKTTEEKYNILISNPVTDGELNSEENTKKVWELFAGDFDNEKDLEKFLIFGPILSKDLQNNEYVETIKEKISLTPLELANEFGPELGVEIFKLSNFLDKSDQDRLDFMKNNDYFSMKLRDKGFSMLDDVMLFSNDPESNLIKNNILDKIDSSGLDFSSKNQILQVYSIYSSELYKNCDNVTNYRDGLNLFLNTFTKELDVGVNLENLVSKFVGTLTTIVKIGIKKGEKISNNIAYKLNDINTLRMSDFINRNFKEEGLENALLVLSFAPYLGDCIDIGYGSYKYMEGKDFSGNEVSEGDSIMQLAFGVIGLSINLVSGIGGSGLKAFLKSLPNNVKESYTSSIFLKLKPYLKDISNIMNNEANNVLVSSKQIKNILVSKVLPEISNITDELIVQYKRYG